MTRAVFAHGPAPNRIRRRLGVIPTVRLPWRVAWPIIAVVSLTLWAVVTVSAYRVL